ncbi:MAG: ATP-binding cassette domain-containing protein [Opitutaceae bacterium]|jgi:cobalt/nickel transport system ATP-binding protein|nr:ATP-binding cassette domain-containing protein [Opitutaceae bacterium]
MPPPILETRELHFTWPGAARAAALCDAQRLRALDGVSLALRPGARLALLGANGSGKTTLLLHLNGTLSPGSGLVLHDGAPLDRSRRGLLALRQHVALVFQDPDDQLFAGTLAQDVSYGPLNLGLDPAAAARRVAEALAATGLENLGELPLHMLSHGQRKRAALAGALALRPRALLLDEPTAGLDPEGVSTLLAHLDRLNAQGMAILFSTHHLALARAWAGEVAIMSAGRILAAGAPAPLLSDAPLLQAARLHLTLPPRRRPA